MNKISEPQNDEYRLGILLLAAGASRRFEGIKQLAILENEACHKKTTVNKGTMLQLVLDKVSQLPALQRIVTLGAHKDEILSEIQLPKNISITTVKDWQEGIAASIRSGIATLKPHNLSHLLILLADQPALAINDYNQLIVLSCNNLQNIICAHYGQKNAVPAIFPASCFPLLEQLQGDKGAGKALNSETLRQDIISVNMGLGEKDIDTRADLMQLQRDSYFQRNSY